MTKEAQQKFITYVRTKQFWQSRFRDGDPMKPVFIPSKDIRELFQLDPISDIQFLEQAGLIIVNQKITKEGHKISFYKATQPGGINPSMLKPKGRPLNNLTTYMRDILKSVSLRTGSDSTLFFDTFLMLQRTHLNLFFTVDIFSGRVHTPISNFHRPYRPNILLDGKETASLDVVTMQPLLLGKILKSEIGPNEYSSWIDSGQDIYLVIQDKAHLTSRDEAKKRFFEILFSRPNEKLAQLFGNAEWINWINEYKGKPIASNPHTVEKEHSNLAWLLQTTEVKVMEKVWKQLAALKIPFLSVHDEIIVKQMDFVRTRNIFEDVLKEQFDYYKLNNKHINPEVEQILIYDDVLTNTSTELIQCSGPPVIDWSQEIANIDSFFSTATLPQESFKLDQCTTILDVPKFVTSHMTLIKANQGKDLFLPYLSRLQELKNVLKIINN